MGVYIKDMEMPKNCRACRLKMNCEDCEGFECVCLPLHTQIGYLDDLLTDKRRDDCPLVPVPPHGLIDRERILDSIRIELAQVNAVNDMEDYDSWMRVFDYVRKFPTVIPASAEVTKQNWIPVTERLPDNIDEEVLVCNEDYGKSGLGFVTVAIYDGSDWLECWERKQYLACITHWMPLPKSPKE